MRARDCAGRQTGLPNLWKQPGGGFTKTAAVFCMLCYLRGQSFALGSTVCPNGITMQERPGPKTSNA